MIGQRAASRRQRERGVGQRSEAEAASGSSKSRTLFRRRFQFLDTRTKFSAIRTRFQGRFALSPWINPVDISSKCIQCFAVKEGVDCSLEANGRLSCCAVSFVRAPLPIILPVCVKEENRRSSNTPRVCDSSFLSLFVNHPGKIW